MNIIQTCLLVWVLVLPGAVFGADLATVTNDCDGCHGAQGVSTDSDVPSIAGQSAAFISDALRSFQQRGRPCQRGPYRHGDTSRPATTMCKISADLPDADIDALGKYYAEQPFVAAKQDFDAARAAAGAQLYEADCKSCHPEQGRVSGRGPILAGQWVPYLKVAVRQALTGEHLVPPFMEKPLADFSDEKIDALMNFFASQQD